MNKLLTLLLFTSMSIAVSAQQEAYSDEKLNIQVKVESLKDKKNDRFYEYYTLEITNISNEVISFTPIFDYETNQGQVRSSTSHDVTEPVILAPGETITGNIEDRRNLTLFKQFLPGNSGKKSSPSIYSLKSIRVEY